MTRLRTYSELIRLETFEERFEYLRLVGEVGRDTFGYDRYLNQGFYKSREWRLARTHTIGRDNGCDLGDPDRPIYDRVYVHHMNPIRPQDFDEFNPDILNPEYLITVTHETHNAIHYGDSSGLIIMPPERRPGDTKLW